MAKRKPKQLPNPAPPGPAAENRGPVPEPAPAKTTHISLSITCVRLEVSGSDDDVQQALASFGGLLHALTSPPAMILDMPPAKIEHDPHA